jgi:hypothetical protein
VVGASRPTEEKHDSVRRAFVYNILGISKRTIRLIKMLHEAYRRVRTVKHLSDAFPFKNILKELGALSPFIFDFSYTMP